MANEQAPTSPAFSLRDVEEWVQLGIVTTEQAEAIRRRAPSSAGESRPSRRVEGLTIAYYAGGITVLLAYTLFMGQQWQRFGPLAQSAIAAFSIATLWLLGFVIRSRASRTGGDLLIFAGAGAMPLLVYSLQRLFGLGDITQTFFSYDRYYTTIAPAWVTMELVSLAVAVLALVITRFPLHALLIAHWSWFLSLDGARFIARSPRWEWTETQFAIGLAVGLTLLALAVITRMRTTRNYSLWFLIYGFPLVWANATALAGNEGPGQLLAALLGAAIVAVGDFIGSRGQLTARSWFYFVGHALMLTQLSAIALRNEGLWGLVFFAIYVSVVVLSVRLQSRIFLVFGALGCYGYVSYLAFKLFADSLGFPFALAITGLLMVLSAVAYERVGRPWLRSRLTSQPVAA
jgi:hypothetical protein